MRLVALAEVSEATTPLNLTSLLAATGSKLAPAIVTLVPGEPLSGVKLVMVGAATVMNWLVTGVRALPAVSFTSAVSESV